MRVLPGAVRRSRARAHEFRVREFISNSLTVLIAIDSAALVLHVVLLYTVQLLNTMLATYVVHIT